jgi:hypothetical protein
MADRPILFSAPMIRALLDGRKTQTRRALKPQPDTAKISPPFHPEARGGHHWVFMARDDFPEYSYATYDFNVPFAVGERLWVRESVRAVEDDDNFDRHLEFLADGERIKVADAGDVSSDSFGDWWKLVAYHSDDPDLTGGKIVPSIFMPRWASRLTLIVTDVRVQRLQEISEQDAISEGIERNGDGFLGHEGADTAIVTSSATDAYRILWDSLNADRGFGWDANPWVVAVSFTVERRNIDQVAP